MRRIAEIDRLRPRLTREQIESLEVGDRVRDIPGLPFEVIAFVDGKGDDSLAVMAYWHARHTCWRYVVVSSHELEALYTPFSLPVAP